MRTVFVGRSTSDSSPRLPVQRQHRPYDLIRAAFATNQAARTEFRQCAVVGETRLATAAVAGGRDVGHQRQARKIVARQKTFGWRDTGTQRSRWRGCSCRVAAG